jgi:hypothetical protein
MSLPLCLIGRGLLLVGERTLLGSGGPPVFRKYTCSMPRNAGEGIPPRHHEGGKLEVPYLGLNFKIHGCGQKGREVLVLIISKTYW